MFWSHAQAVPPYIKAGRRQLPPCYKYWVGKPKDGDAMAGYVILNLTEASNVNMDSSITVEFIKVPYDVEKAAQAVEDSPLPNEYTQMLRRAF